MTICIGFCVIVIQPINIGEQEKQAMLFTTIVQVKEFNGLQCQLSFSYNRYENMGKVKNNVKIFLNMTTH